MRYIQMCVLPVILVFQHPTSNCYDLMLGSVWWRVHVYMSRVVWDVVVPILWYLALSSPQTPSDDKQSCEYESRTIERSKRGWKFLKPKIHPAALTSVCFRFQMTLEFAKYVFSVCSSCILFFTFQWLTISLPTKRTKKSFRHCISWIFRL